MFVSFLVIYLLVGLLFGIDAYRMMLLPKKMDILPFSILWLPIVLFPRMIEIFHKKG